MTFFSPNFRDFPHSSIMKCSDFFPLNPQTMKVLLYSMETNKFPTEKTGNNGCFCLFQRECHPMQLIPIDFPCYCVVGRACFFRQFPVAMVTAQRST